MAELTIQTKTHRFFLSIYIFFRCLLMVNFVRDTLLDTGIQKWAFILIKMISS